jgi:peptide/nickel transport system substrate-binding protein
VRIGLIGPLTLDPASTSPASASAMALADLLHDSLTELGPDGAPQPELADFVPGDDLRTWRFTLVEGATFADGTAVEADDVVATLERIRAQGGGSLASVQLEGVASVSAVDPRTVEIALTEPSALVPEILSSPLYGVVDRDLPPGLPGAPVNPSGDHAVVEATVDRLLLERRRGQGPARVELRLLADEDAALTAFTGGRLDVSPVPADRLSDLAGVGTEVLTPFHAGILLGLRMDAEPLVRPALRQALALAVDRPALAAAVFGAGAQAARGLIPEGVPGAAASCAGPCGPDVERARQLLAEAFPDGGPPSLRLLTDETSTHDAIVRILRQQLGEIGLELDVQAADEGTYAGQLSTAQVQLFLTGALGVSRSPGSHLLPWTPGSPDDLTGHRNDLVAGAIAAAVVEPDLPVRTARWQEVEAATLGDVPVVPLVQLRTVSAVSERVSGLVVRVDGTFDLAGVRLSG